MSFLTLELNRGIILEMMANKLIGSISFVGGGSQLVGLGREYKLKRTTRRGPVAARKTNKFMV